MGNIVTLLLLLFATPVMASTHEDFHVIVDPGHGGNDSGAVRGRLREADIALDVAKKLKELLDKNSDFESTLTRTHDEYVSLPARLEIARKTRADLFVSIHLNSALDARAQGGEFYFQNQLPPEEESLFLANRENQTEQEDVELVEKSKPHTEVGVIKEDLLKTYQLVMSRELAKELKGRWIEDHGIVRSSVKQGPFRVISFVPMPSILVELGFISHPKESKWLSQPETHEAIAMSLYKGILAVKERMDKFSQKGHISAHAN